MSTAGQLLREARRRAGLSQAGLARLARTSQPTISAYERGEKDPSVSTLERLLAVTGTRLIGRPGPASVRAHVRGSSALSAFSPDDLAAVAQRVRAGEELWVAVREFLDGVALYAESGTSEDVAALLQQEPVPTDDPRIDSLLGGLGEHIAVTRRLPRPSWVCDPERFLDAMWFPHHRRAFDAIAVRDAPAAFRRRGIFLHPSMLQRV